MCLIAWNWQPASATPLLLLSNRDEFYARPARPLQWWEGGEVLAGQDLQAGGTWLGVNRRGWLAALTNYRMPVPDGVQRPSRGHLVSNFLQGSASARDYLETVVQQSGDFNPFNLLVFDGTELCGLESRHQRVLRFQPGIGGVSNADFHTPWPKLQRLTEGLQRHGTADTFAVDALWPLLHDQSAVPLTELPDTGIPAEREQLLATAFIRSDVYGTRACSVVRIGASGVDFHEQNHSERGMLGTAQQFFTL